MTSFVTSLIVHIVGPQSLQKRFRPISRRPVDKIMCESDESDSGSGNRAEPEPHFMRL